MEKPVKEGEEYDVTIEAIGEQGDGIARIEGFVVFVPNVKAGDRVKIMIKKVLNKVSFGEVVSKLESVKKVIVEEFSEDDLAEEAGSEDF